MSFCVVWHSLGFFLYCGVNYDGYITRRLTTVNMIALYFCYHGGYILLGSARWKPITWRRPTKTNNRYTNNTDWMSLPARFRSTSVSKSLPSTHTTQYTISTFTIVFYNYTFLYASYFIHDWQDIENISKNNEFEYTYLIICRYLKLVNNLIINRKFTSCYNYKILKK